MLFRAVCALIIGTPSWLFAQETCPFSVDQVLTDVFSSQDVFDIVSTIPPEKDEFQTTQEYQAQVLDILGPLAGAGIFEVDEKDRSFISYNADLQRIEVSTGLFASYGSLDFSRYDLKDYFEKTIDYKERTPFDRHFIISLSDSSELVNTFTGKNALGTSTEVSVYNRVSVSVHGGIVVDPPASSVWSFAPDDISDSKYGLPVYTIPMDSDSARTQMPILRGIVALSGLSREFLATKGYDEATISKPKEIRSTNFLFTSDVICAGFIDSDDRVLKVMEKLDTPFKY